MKKFIYKVFVFVLPVVFLSVPLDYFFSYILKTSHLTSGEYEVWNDIYNSTANCDVAIYGSSRAWVHIDPDILSDTLNVNVYNLLFMFPLVIFGIFIINWHNCLDYSGS